MKVAVDDIFAANLVSILLCRATFFQCILDGSREIDRNAKALRVVYKQHSLRKHNTADHGDDGPPEVATANQSIADADLDWSSVVGGFLCPGVR